MRKKSKTCNLSQCPLPLRDRFDICLYSNSLETITWRWISCLVILYFDHISIMTLCMMNTRVLVNLAASMRKAVSCLKIYFMYVIRFHQNIADLIGLSENTFRVVFIEWNSDILRWRVWYLINETVIFTQSIIHKLHKQIWNFEHSTYTK